MHLLLTDKIASRLKWIFLCILFLGFYLYFFLLNKFPLFYDRFLKSFNIPELVRSKVNLDPGIISGELSKKPIKVKFSSKY
jgi:hypothetical protein